MPRVGFDVEFLFYALKMKTPYIVRLGANTTVPILNKSDFSKIKLRIPSLQEQRKIADFLSALDRKIGLVGQELTHARSFKQGLLQQMFV